MKRALLLWDKFAAIGAETFASSTTYFTFSSLIPMLALCVSLVSYTGLGKEEVIAFFTALAPAVFDKFVEALVKEAFNSSGIAFSISTIFLIWSASKGMKALLNGLNAAYAVEESRNPVLVTAVSVAASIVFEALLAATIYFIFKGRVVTLLREAIPTLSATIPTESLLNDILAVAFISLVLDVLYTLLPSGKRSLRWQLPGAVCAALACVLLSLGFRVYVEHFVSFTVLYGSIAMISLFLLWMYLLSFALILGGFLNRIVEESRSTPNETEATEE